MSVLEIRRTNEPPRDAKPVLRVLDGDMTIAELVADLALKGESAVLYISPITEEATNA